MNSNKAARPPFRPGDVIDDRYEVRALLDQGGSSEVYLATDRALHRNVVIKAPRAALLRDPQAMTHFRREARALARVTHPLLVTIHDVGLDPHGPYLVEEHVPGRSLADVVKDEAPMPAARAAEIGAAVADALTAVHDAGMVHRDVKPGNVMLTPDGGVKLLDLGIAWAADWTPVSGTDEILGTAAYVSPEQALGGPLDARSDLYSLGVVLYEMLTGRTPFAGTTLEILEHHARRPPVPLRSIRPDVPSRLAAVVEGCLAKEKDRRPPNARAVADKLRTSCLPTPDAAGTARRAAGTVPLRGPAATERLPRARTPGRRWVVRLGAAAALLVTALVMLALPQAEASLHPPSKIAAQGECDGFLKFRVTITWQAPRRGADGFIVFRRSLPDGKWTTAAILHDPLATTYVDHGRGASSDYTYEVRTTAGDRMSGPSSPATADTPLFCFG